MSLIPKIIIIVTCVFALLAATLVIVHHYAVEKAENMISKEAKRWGLELDNASAGLTCFKSLRFKGSDDTQIAIDDLCLDDGLFSLRSDAPNVSVSIRSVTGNITLQMLKKLKDRQKEPSAQEPNPKKASLIAKVLNANADIQINKAELTIGEPKKQIKLLSEAAKARLDKGLFSVKTNCNVALDLVHPKLVIQNTLDYQVDAQIDLNAFLEHKKRELTGQIVKYIVNEKAADQIKNALPDTNNVHQLPDNAIAQITVNATSPLNVTVNQNDKKVQTTLGQFGATYTPETLNLYVGDVQVSIDETTPLGSAQFKRITTSIKDIETSPKLSLIQLTDPDIRIDLQQALQSEKVKSHPVLGKLTNFWQRDNTNLFGDAPKLSVRREDVKKAKTKPKIKKNPIPKETLQAIQKGFQSFQKTIMSLPAIDIQNGRVEFKKEDTKLAFEAVSFNTAELFKDDQKFKLEFNIHNASTSFEVSYDDESVFPTLSLKVDQLKSEDFLKFLNMPIPEKNAGTFSGALTLSIDDNSFKLNGDVDFKQFAFFHAKISPNQIHDLNASAKLDVVYNFAEDQLAIQPLEVTSGPITASGYFKITDVRSDPVIEFELGAKDIPCSDIPKAIPPGFLPSITDLQIAGSTFSPKLTGKIPWKNPLVATLKDSGFEDKCFPTSVAPHQPETLNSPKYTFTTNYTYFTDAITVGPGTKDFTPLTQIPPYVRAAMFLSEDKRFFDHGPLRVSFIERALRLNLNTRKYVYGGSTISQQLTKNLFLVRTKNLARKLEEAFIAWRMENVVPKSRILELYINMIEFGPDIYGITKAAKFYFGKTPSELTPLEGAYLASLKVKPSQGGKFYKSGFSQDSWFAKRTKQIMKTLAENGYITPAEVIAAYPWTPRFVYPDPSNTSDFRNVWLRKYGEYQVNQARSK